MCGQAQEILEETNETRGCPAVFPCPLTAQGSTSSLCSTVPPELMGVTFLSQTVTLSHETNRHAHGQGASGPPNPQQGSHPPGITSKPQAALAVVSRLIRELSCPDAARVCELSGSFQLQEKWGYRERGRKEVCTLSLRLLTAARRRPQVNSGVQTPFSGLRVGEGPFSYLEPRHDPRTRPCMVGRDDAGARGLPRRFGTWHVFLRCPCGRGGTCGCVGPRVPTPRH